MIESKFYRFIWRCNLWPMRGKKILPFFCYWRNAIHKFFTFCCQSMWSCGLCKLGTFRVSQASRKLELNRNLIATITCLYCKLIFLLSSWEPWHMSYYCRIDLALQICTYRLIGSVLCIWWKKAWPLKH